MLFSNIVIVLIQYILAMHENAYSLQVTNRPDWKSGASGGCMRISNAFCYSSMYRQDGARNGMMEVPI